MGDPGPVVGKRGVNAAVALSAFSPVLDSLLCTLTSCLQDQIVLATRVQGAVSVS